MRYGLSLVLCFALELGAAGPALRSSDPPTFSVYLAWVTAKPAVPHAGRWAGGGCQTPGGPCNDVGFAVSVDGRSVEHGYIQAGRDHMACQGADITDGTFSMSCGGGSGKVTARFDTGTQASGHYVVDWQGFPREEADWTAAWISP